MLNMLSSYEKRSDKAINPNEGNQNSVTIRKRTKFLVKLNFREYSSEKISEFRRRSCGSILFFKTVLNPLLLRTVGCGKHIVFQHFTLGFAKHRKINASENLHAKRAAFFFKIGNTKDFALLAQTLRIELDETKQKTDELEKFISKVKKITEIKELTPELVHEFISKIVVHAPYRKDKRRHQAIDIYYNGVGIVYIPEPEESEMMFQEHLCNLEEKQNNEKTA